MNVITGTMMARSDVIVDPTSSPVDTIGFPTPAVVTDDAPRTATVVT